MACKQKQNIAATEIILSVSQKKFFSNIYGVSYSFL